MNADEFKKIREGLNLSREEVAKLLGLSGYMYVSNIENGLRNPNKLAIKLLRYLSSMTNSRATKFIEEINKF